MDQVNLINQDVNVVAFYFRSNARRLRCFPKRMEYDNQRVDFTETGTMQPAEQFGEEVHIFDMSDGNCEYRLQFNPASLSWKLIAISTSRYEPVFTQFAAAV